MTAAPTSDLRALDVVEAVPAGCIAVMVTGTAWSPHLRPGEWAIVDTTDTAPQRGELFALRFLSVDGLRTRIVQVGRYLDPDAVPIRYGPGQGDGPLTAEGWTSKCRGRIVGVILVS